MIRLPSPILRLSAALAALLPVAASAGTTIQVPEPETWALFAIAAVAAAVVTIRNKRK